MKRSVRSLKLKLIPACPVDFDLAYDFALSEQSKRSMQTRNTFEYLGRVFGSCRNPLINTRTTHNTDQAPCSETRNDCCMG